ncbi:MAG: hypothetical protein QOF09_4190, partial [Alphaproteobacteria bacterium]|nr:hypothetical protein [Alphaproteobacteria bacterium]
PGIHWSDAEAMGVLDQDRNAMFVEAIDQILAIWASEPPYRLKGEPLRLACGAPHLRRRG